MVPGTFQTSTVRAAARALALLLAAGAAASPALAQYKWQTPDGQTVYSDVPPNAPDITPRRIGEAIPASDAVVLPYDLRTAAGKFPVTLYSAPDCAPCTQARTHLQVRGIPFAEKLVATTADFDAFKALGFADNSFPALAVGRERSIGFESGVWNRLLTAAGYPEKSKLPLNYQQARAEPLTPAQPQQLTVNIQRESAAPAGDAAADSDAATRSQRAIDQYRASLQAAERARAQAENASPSLRF
ncbi:MAG: glutaredoxin family protein [Lautropia sp.]